MDLLKTKDPEAAAFFADARAALIEPTPDAAEESVRLALPRGWPMTPAHTGMSLTIPELHEMRGHATRISFDWMTGRQAMWVGKEFGSWSIVRGQIDGPASLLTSRYEWAETVRALNEYIVAGRAFGGPNLTVDEWLPEFTLVCLAHGDGCGEHEGGHNFVHRRTLPRHPAGAYRTCGGCRRDGDYRYRFQVQGRWRLRYGCGSHHAELLKQYLAEADGTVTVRLIDDHLRTP
ncbi:hypothetical protein [Streptomyces niveus]|uniref:hypothetical protein n=1 Tax=Streptomyces niveus TaxID=193462 RepID=UPI00386673F1